MVNSDTYLDTIPNAAGCDSIITVNLTILQSSSSIIETACDSYTSPSGLFTWTTSDTYMDTILNTAGCDSIITIDLTINSVNISVKQSKNTLTADALKASYKWLNCNNNYSVITDEINQSYTAINSGSYAVEVTQSSCIDTSECIAISVITGIIENDFGSTFIFYPNPTQGNISIELGEFYSSVTIVIKNIKGQLISVNEFKAVKNFDFKFDGANGLYLIDVYTGDGKKAKIKVLKD